MYRFLRSDHFPDYYIPQTHSQGEDSQVYTFLSIGLTRMSLFQLQQSCNLAWLDGPCFQRPNAERGKESRWPTTYSGAAHMLYLQPNFADCSSPSVFCVPIICCLTTFEGFYKYKGFDEYPLKEILSAKAAHDAGSSPALTEKLFSISFLLRCDLWKQAAKVPNPCCLMLVKRFIANVENPLPEPMSKYSCYEFFQER